MKNILLFIGLLLYFVQSSAQSTSGLVAYYALNGSLKDSSKSKIHGQLIDGTFTKDRYGNPNSALKLDGKDDYAIIPKFGKYIPLQDFTLCFWAKSVVVTRSTLMMLYPNVSGDSSHLTVSLYYTYSPDGCFYWDYASPKARHLVYPYAIDTSWQFFVFYHNSNTKRVGIYKNVKLMGQQTVYLGFVADSSKTMNLGRGSQGNYTGTIDDLRMYNRVLDTSEIRSMYKYGFCYSKISLQPKDQSLTLGDTAKFKVTFSDSNAIYKWQLKSGNSFVDIIDTGQYKGAKTKELKILNVKVSVNNNQKFRCLVKTAECKDSSILVTLTVKCSPIIKNEPGDNDIRTGSNAEFIVSSFFINPAWQWQRSQGSAYKDISDGGQFLGSNNDTLNVLNVSWANNNSFYRAVAIYDGCKDTSKGVKLSVFDCNPVLNTHPSSKSVFIGSKVKFGVSALEFGTTFQWQVKVDSTFINILDTGQYSGVKTDSLSISNITLFNKNQKYRCVMTFNKCKEISNIATLDVECKALVNKQPDNKTVKDGSRTIFTVSSLHPLTTFIWQTSISSGYFNLADGNKYLGANNDTLTVLNISSSNHNQKYRCILSLGGCVDTSQSVYLEVCENQIISHPINQSIFVSGSTFFNVVSKKTNSGYKWQSSFGFGYQDVVNSSLFKGVNKDTLFVNNAALQENKQKFRCIITSGGCMDTSLTASLEVKLLDGNQKFVTGRISIVPNPASNIIFIIGKEKGEVMIFDMYGKELTAKSYSSQEPLNIESLSKGIYFVKCTSDGINYTGRFIKN
jgi:hypothetical protein